MKILKQSIIFLLLIFPFFTYGQLNITGYIETGYYNETISLNGTAFETVGTVYIEEWENIGTREIFETREINTEVELRNKKSMYSEISILLNWKGFHLEQNVFDIFKHESDGGYTFTPLEIFYTTKFYYNWKWLRIGYSHQCIHPIGNSFKKEEIIRRRGSYDKIYVRITFSNKKE